MSQGADDRSSRSSERLSTNGSCATQPSHSAHAHSSEHKLRLERSQCCELLVERLERLPHVVEVRLEEQERMQERMQEGVDRAHACVLVAHALLTRLHRLTVPAAASLDMTEFCATHWTEVGDFAPIEYAHAAESM